MSEILTDTTVTHLCVISFGSRNIGAQKPDLNLGLHSGFNMNCMKQNSLEGKKKGISSLQVLNRGQKQSWQELTKKLQHWVDVELIDECLTAELYRQNLGPTQNISMRIGNLKLFFLQPGLLIILMGMVTGSQSPALLTGSCALQQKSEKCYLWPLRDTMRPWRQSEARSQWHQNISFWSSSRF